MARCFFSGAGGARLCLAVCCVPPCLLFCFVLFRFVSFRFVLFGASVGGSGFQNRFELHPCFSDTRYVIILRDHFCSRASLVQRYVSSSRSSHAYTLCVVGVGRSLLIATSRIGGLIRRKLHKVLRFAEGSGKRVASTRWRVALSIFLDSARAYSCVRWQVVFFIAIGALAQISAPNYRRNWHRVLGVREVVLVQCMVRFLDSVASSSTKSRHYIAVVVLHGQSWLVLHLVTYGRLPRLPFCPVLAYGERVDGGVGVGNRWVR